MAVVNMTSEEFYMFLRYQAGQNMPNAQKIVNNTPRSNRLKVAMSKSGMKQADVEFWLKNEREK